VKVCTKPTSCEFDLKSVTYSKMAKSRAEHLSLPKKKVRPQICDQFADGKKYYQAPVPVKKKGCRLADLQLTDLEIWDTLIGHPPHSSASLRLWVGEDRNLRVSNLAGNRSELYLFLSNSHEAGAVAFVFRSR
jgi:hypothetical protein